MKNIDNVKFQDIKNTFKDVKEDSKDINIKNRFSYNIFLIGFMGVGKTTVSSFLSSLMNMKEIDIDNHIETVENMTVSEIFNKFGEKYFRDCETRTLIELKEKQSMIVSCGGGIVLKEENINLMRTQGKIILLTASPKTIFERVRYSTDRPILNNNMNIEFISSLMEKRSKKYLSAADLIIDTNNKSVEKVCEDIIEELAKLNHSF